jgi:crotonobetainyl-CoA:carnitine CoA-transferase CaiB-like acyl-CoA transferase
MVGPRKTKPAAPKPGAAKPAAAGPAATGPLSGVRVLDLTSVLMGPFATQTLGDMGADVIKVEAPPQNAGDFGGDSVRCTSLARTLGMSNIFLNTNRNKRSAVIDLKNAEGREAFLKLAATCDVLVYNVRPQAMQRLKLGYEDVRAVNPKIIYVGCFGFGQNGPYAARAAYDDLIQAMTAVPDMVARASGGEHRYVPINFCDRVTGLNVVNAITAALFHRERSGEGQAIEIPMFETMAQFSLGEHLGGHSFEPPEGPMGYARILNVHRKPHRTRDGYLAVLVYIDKHWKTFFELIGQPELIHDPVFATMASRSANIAEVYAWLGQIIERKSTAQWLELLKDADIPHAVSRSIDSLLDDEHLKAVGFFQTFDHPSEGRVRMTGIPSTWSATPLSIRRLAPRLGEHTDEVLREAGYSGEEAAQLISRGVARKMGEGGKLE